MMNDNAQWMRKWSLIVGDEKDGLDISELHCDFSIEKTDASSPNTAEFTIFNPSPETIDKIKTAFTKIIVNAGYDSNFGLIFTGNIKGAFYGKKGTDSYVTITAGDGDREYNYTVINKTIAAGSTPAERNNVLVGAMGMKTNYSSELRKDALPRGRVFYGRPADLLSEQSKTQDAIWSIQDGEVQILKRNELLPNEAVLLTGQTGLIGRPERTEDGIEGECLLNPLLRIGAVVKLENSNFNESVIKENKDTKEKTQANMNTDGLYRLISITHSGNNYGGEWSSKWKALDVNETSKDDKVTSK